MRETESISRRSVLLGLTGAAAALSETGARIRIGCQTNAWNINPGDLDSLLRVLASIQQLGFEGFETGYRNLQSQFERPQNARARLDGSGLQFFGIHVFLQSYDPRTAIAPWELLKSVADGGAVLGAKRLIVSGASTPDKPSFSRKAQALDRIGAYCRSKNLRLAYHNHQPEFQHHCFQMEHLLGDTDPELVHFVIDAGHAMEGLLDGADTQRAGMDLASFFSRHSGRVDGMHVRDARKGVEVPFGQGDYDWKPLAAAIRTVNWKGWLLCEEERLNGEKLGEAVVRPAREGVRRVFGV